MNTDQLSILDAIGEPADDVLRTAYLSTDGVYRWTLHRTWGSPDDPVVFVMLNPSTADATKDDRTIGRCSSFARRWGHGGLAVVNLYAYRATKPEDMFAAAAAGTDIVGNLNDRMISGLLDRAGLVVAAWGVNARPDRVAAFQRLAWAAEKPVHHLGLTKGGAPRHPLYLLGDTQPTLWTEFMHGADR